MPASQFKRYIWLVDTIRSAGRISRQDIDRRWANSSLNDTKEVSLSYWRTATRAFPLVHYD